MKTLIKINYILSKTLLKITSFDNDVMYLLGIKQFFYFVIHQCKSLTRLCNKNRKNCRARDPVKLLFSFYAYIVSITSLKRAVTILRFTFPVGESLKPSDIVFLLFLSILLMDSPFGQDFYIFVYAVVLINF